MNSAEQMLGQKFLKEINAEDADHILAVLKQYGSESLIDKWVSVKIIATEVRKAQKVNVACRNPTDRASNLFWNLDEDWKLDESGNPFDEEDSLKSNEGDDLTAFIVASKGQV